jgi:hypothetical protein
MLDRAVQRGAVDLQPFLRVREPPAVGFAVSDLPSPPGAQEVRFLAEEQFEKRVVRSKLLAMKQGAAAASAAAAAAVAASAGPRMVYPMQ